MERSGGDLAAAAGVFARRHVRPWAAHHNISHDEGTAWSVDGWGGGGDTRDVIIFYILRSVDIIVVMREKLYNNTVGEHGLIFW